MAKNLLDKVNSNGIRIGSLGKSLTKLPNPEMPKLPKPETSKLAEAIISGSVDRYIKCAAMKGLKVDPKTLRASLAPRIQRLISTGKLPL